MLKFIGFVFIVAFVQFINGTIEPCQILNPELYAPADLPRLAGNWSKMASSPYEVTPMLPCELMVADYNPDNETIVGRAYHYVDRYSPKLLDFTQLITQNPNGSLSVDTLTPVGVENRYMALISDYDNYVIDYTCIWVNGEFGGRTIWIGSRTPEFNENNFLLAIQKLSQLGVPPQEWTMNYSQDC